jgi:hypothetical protein
MRGFALGLSLSVAFIIGCLAGPHLTPSADAQAGATTYQYACVEGSSSDRRLNEIVNAQGRRGRELVAVGVGGAGENAVSQWCFRIH